MTGRRKYYRVLVQVPPPGPAERMRQAAQRLARGLSDDTLALTSVDRMNAARFLSALASYADILDVMQQKKPRKRSSRYPGIAFHAVLLERLGRADRNAVATSWCVDVTTVTDALTDYRADAEYMLRELIEQGAKWGKYSECDVLEGELAEEIPKLQRRRTEHWTEDSKDRKVQRITKQRKKTNRSKALALRKKKQNNPPRI